MNDLAPTPVVEPRERDLRAADADELLRAAVCEALAAVATFDVNDMNVGVDNGEVILSGVCPCIEARATAETVALSVHGVRGVHNFVGIKLLS